MVRNVVRNSPTHHASSSVGLVKLNHSRSHDCASRSLNDTRIRPPTRSSKARRMKPVVSEPVAGKVVGVEPPVGKVVVVEPPVAGVVVVESPVGKVVVGITLVMVNDRTTSVALK